jgi:hypothetical protein
MELVGPLFLVVVVNTLGSVTTTSNNENKLE